MGLRETFGRNFNITKEIRTRYHKLSTGFIFRFYSEEGKATQVSLKYIFMLCLALGYAKGKRKPLDNPYPLINVDGFRDDELWAIASIAVKEKGGDIRVVEDGPEMKKIASEYANDGLDRLEDLIDEYGSGRELMIALDKISQEYLGKIKLKDSRKSDA